jgi:hypothetical protein
MLGWAKAPGQIFEDRSTQSYEDILAQFPGPVLLRASRRKWGGLLVVCSLFVLGIWFVLHAPGTIPSLDRLILWLGVPFSGVGVLFTASRFGGCSGAAGLAGGTPAASWRLGAPALGAKRSPMTRQGEPGPPPT